MRIGGHGNVLAAPRLPTGKLVLGLALAGLASGCARVEVQPVRLEARLRFSHQAHSARTGCSDCHGAVAESAGPTLGRFIGRGTHGGCEQCHEVRAGDKCAVCHIGADRQVRLTRLDRGLRFSHAAHQSRVSGGHRVCHSAAGAATRPGTRRGPEMASCTSRCHQRDQSELRCEKCHRDLRRQGLRPLTLFRHGQDFIRRHGGLARDVRRCATCHDQTHCAGCHARTAALPLSIRFPERIEARFIHRGDFLGRHAVEARASAAACRQCHGTEHCRSCHELRGLAAPADAPPGPNRSNVHGADFMTPGNPRFHGRLARRNAADCAGCHDRGPATNCIECHRVGALGGNPHPRGFRWNQKSESCRSNALCLVCHLDGGGCPP